MEGVPKPAARLLRIRRDRLLDDLALFVTDLVARDRSVLIATSLHPAPYLVQQLQTRGVNTRRVFVVDALGAEPDAHAVDPNHMHRLPNPTLLELMAARTERIIRTKAEGKPHVLILTCDSFAAYNPVGALEQIVRYIVDHLLKPGGRIDFLLEEPTRVPPALLEFLVSYIGQPADMVPA